MFREAKGPLDSGALARALQVNPEAEGVLARRLNAMERDGQLRANPAGEYALTDHSSFISGRISAHRDGFGFVIPDVPNAHGDLFIPAGDNLDAVTGDFVVAKVIVREKYDTRDKRNVSGRIVEILKRATNKVVGAVARQNNRWVVIPDGTIFKTPIEVQDVTAKNAAENDKVVVAGLSMGAALVLRLAADRAHEVAGVVVVNPAVATKRLDVKLLPVLKHLVPAFPGIANDIKKPGVQEHGYDKTPLKAAHSMMQAWKPLVADLPKITAPLLYLRSTEDHVVDEPDCSASPRLNSMISLNDPASKSASSRSKLNACPSPSALAYRARRSAATQASATAVRAGVYSSKTCRHSA